MKQLLLLYLLDINKYILRNLNSKLHLKTVFLYACCSDRYVIYGNHRDSWVHGAIDPSSGTAVMLEITRVLGKMVKEGQA